MDASSPPPWKTLDKRKAWGGFWGPFTAKSPFHENAHFDGIHIFPFISKGMVGNRGIPHILALGGERAAQKHPQNLMFIK